MMNHALSSEALRRERALTREERARFYRAHNCDCEDPGPKAAPATPLEDLFASKCSRPPQGALILPHWASIRQGAPMFQACRHSCKTDTSEPRRTRKPSLMARAPHSPHRSWVRHTRLSGTQRVRIHTKRNSALDRPAPAERTREQSAYQSAAPYQDAQGYSPIKPRVR